MEGSLIEDVVSEGSIPNINKGKKIEAEALQVKFKIMKQVVASSPKINLKCMGRKMALLLDSGSMVSLVQQSYFDWNIKQKLGPARGPEATFHNLFNLKGANRGDIPVQRYFDMDVAFLGLRVPKVGIPVVKDPSELLESKRKTKLPGIIRWNLIKLVYQEFVKKYPIEVFSSLQHPQNVDPLLFSQLYVYYYTDIRPAVGNEIIEDDCVHTESIAIRLNEEVVYKNHQTLNILLDWPVGTVQTGMEKEPICIPRNAMLAVPGNTSHICKSQSYIVEQAVHHNLPQGLVVNSCCVIPKTRRVPMILIDTTDKNIWVRQPLLAAELFEVEVEPQQELHQD